MRKMRTNVIPRTCVDRTEFPLYLPCKKFGGQGLEECPEEISVVKSYAFASY